MSGTTRLLLVTDLPYWRRRTGAEQRIFSLARFAQAPPFELHVFYVGQEPLPARPAGSKGPSFYGLDRRQRWWHRQARTRPPMDHAVATVGPVADRSAPTSRGLTLADYRWPTAVQQFRRLVRRVRPDWVVCEYVTMAYLASDLQARPLRGVSPPRFCLDSHDLLHRRQQLFQAAGYSHWLAINESEEREAIQPFDLILAIQDDEAAWFRQQHGAAKILVVGHAVDFGEIVVVPPSAGRAIVLGYFGSNNASNVDAVLGFHRDVWPMLRAECPEATWLIAGTILDHPQVAAAARESAIRTERTVERISDFYAAVDVVINPVRFGTGLKIKNVEALAHGRPVVTTVSGGVGIPEHFGESCWAAETPAAMAARLIDLAGDPALRGALSRQAEQVARQAYCDSAVYRELSPILAGKPGAN